MFSSPDQGKDLAFQAVDPAQRSLAELPHMSSDIWLRDGKDFPTCPGAPHNHTDPCIHQKRKETGLQGHKNSH